MIYFISAFSPYYRQDHILIIFFNQVFYIKNPKYPSSTNHQIILQNRELYYKLTKYILWSFYIDYLYGRDQFVNNTIFQARITRISNMLINIFVDPNTSQLDPNIGLINHTLNNILTTNDAIIYEDNTIIESFQNSEHPYPVGEDNFRAGTIYAGQRYDASNPFVSRNKNSKSIYADSQGTCINREIEFYYVSKNLFHSDNLVTTTINKYFLGLIDASYEDKHNYINTLSYLITVRYLNNYFGNIQVLNSVIDMPTLNQKVSTNVMKGVITTLIDYNRYIFYIWKNSQYNDVMTNPNITTVTVDTLTNTSVTNSIDYFAFYLSDYLFNTYPPLPPSFATVGNPLLARATYYNGNDDISYRPRMLFNLKFILNPSDPSTYHVINGTIVDTTQFLNISQQLPIDTSTYDIFGEYIQGQIQILQNSNESLVTSDAVVRTDMEYIYWLDLNKYIEDAINRVNSDTFNFLSYFDNLFILNHLPFTITWYYGRYMQYILDRFETLIKYNLSHPNHQIAIEDYKLEEVFPDPSTVDGNNPFTEGANINPNKFMRFLSTDVGINGVCPFHGQISNLPSLSTKIEFYTNFLNDPNKPINQTNIMTQCALCFRTFLFQDLFTFLLQNSVTDQSMSHVVDSDYVSLNVITPESLNPTNTYDNVTYLFRPETVVTDTVTKEIYHCLNDYTIVRLCTIYSRYTAIISNIIRLNNIDFTNYFTQPDVTPVNNVPLFVNYEAYLTLLRNDYNISHIDTFNILMEQLIAIISQTETDSTKLQQLLKLINHPEQDNHLPIEGSNDVSFLRFDIHADDAIKMIQNIVKPSDLIGTTYKYVRYQFYRGNVSLWEFLSNNIINSYNTYFNNVTIPSRIGIDADLFVETYKLLMLNVDSKFINKDGTVDFYKFKQDVPKVTTIECLIPPQSKQSQMILFLKVQS